MLLIIGAKKYAVASLADASARFQQARGTRPSSRMPRGIVRDDDGHEVALVSYNGRVWSVGAERRLLLEAAGTEDTVT